MGKGFPDLTPKQRAAWAKRQRVIEQHAEKHGLKDAQDRLQRHAKKHGLKDALERLQQHAEKHGLPSMAGANVLTVETYPAEPTPRQPKPRKRGGGNKPSLWEKQIEEGKAIYRGLLAKEATWADNKTASAARVLEKLKLSKGVSNSTVKR